MTLGGLSDRFGWESDYALAKLAQALIAFWKLLVSDLNSPSAERKNSDARPSDLSRVTFAMPKFRKV